MTKVRHASPMVLTVGSATGLSGVSMVDSGFGITCIVDGIIPIGYRASVAIVICYFKQDLI